jgi:hypothetical protein
VSEEGQLFADGFITESTTSFGYSLSIRLCLMLLISLLKSFWFWHMTFARLTKLWTTSLFVWCGWLDLEVIKSRRMRWIGPVEIEVYVRI